MAYADKKLNGSNVTARLIELIMNMSEAEQRSLLKELEVRLSVRRRKHDRKPYFSVVDYATQDGAYTDFIQNISAGGLFIGTNASFPLGQQLSMGFLLPISQKHIIITGQVVWFSEQGIGVKFNSVGHELEAIIRSLVDMI